MIVSDTGPIIAFARLERLSLLRQVFDVLIIPQAVFDELVQSGPDQPGAPEAIQGEGIIPAVRPIVDELQALGYWIDQSIIRDFLEEMAEG